MLFVGFGWEIFTHFIIYSSTHYSFMRASALRYGVCFQYFRAETAFKFFIQHLARLRL